MSRFDLSNYETVESRLAKFWEQYPNGRVHTEIYYYDDNRVVFRAALYKDMADALPVATGFAEEIRDASPVNRTSFVENAETSAIGRAASNFTFQSKSAPRPSREEMQKVARHEQSAPTTTHPTQRTREQMIADANNKSAELKQASTVTSIQITEAQLKLLQKLCRERSVDATEFAAETLAQDVSDIKMLTKRDASTVINKLMNS